MMENRRSFRIYTKEWLLVIWCSFDTFIHQTHLKRRIIGISSRKINKTAGNSCDRFKTDKIIILMVMFVSVFFIPSCTDLVCLSGVCPTSSDHIERVPWEPQILSHQNCPNISGKYNTMIYFSFPKINSWLGFIHVKVETKDKELMRYLDNIPNYKKINKIDTDYSGFYENSYVLIQQSELDLTVSLMGGDGKLCETTMIALDSSGAGCANGDLIIRSIGTPSYSQSGYSRLYTQERRFRKLADGSLQVMTHKRVWGYDPLFGLTGIIGPNPKESSDTATFASVP